MAPDKKKEHALVLEEQLLTAAIRQTFDEAYVAKTKVFNVMESASSAKHVESRDYQEALNEANELLSHHVNKLFREVSILAERMHLPALVSDIQVSKQTFSDMAALEPTPYDFEFESPPLRAVSDFFQSLQTMTEGRSISGLAIFENILKSTNAILRSCRVRPTSEAQIRAEVMKVLQFSFHDVVREIPIDKLIKSYRPDIGVISLMAAAEYKFVTSETELKKSIDEIYTDMKGYSGRYDWRSFYAVFYMTSDFAYQSKLEDEFRLVKADLSWTPIVVIGAGGRNKTNSVSR